MTGFEFDHPPSPGTNRVAGHHCERCDGHRLILVSEEPEMYARCPVCNPEPTKKPVRTLADAWWNS